MPRTNRLSLLDLVGGIRQSIQKGSTNNTISTKIGRTSINNEAVDVQASGGIIEPRYNNRSHSPIGGISE